MKPAERVPWLTLKQDQKIVPMVHQSNYLRRLGHSDIAVSAVGLGCMGMTWAYGPTDETESLRVLRRYVELGGNFLDTAEIYGPYTNEQLLGRFLRETSRESVVVATKFGFKIDEANQTRPPDSTLANVKRACDASLERLGIEVIDLFYKHRVDPEVPIEETACPVPLLSAC
jgi:aryl-alcohol dehydrogenase-like predicted oxidoreductase